MPPVNDATNQKDEVKPRETLVPMTAVNEMLEGMKKLPSVLNSMGFDSMRPGQDRAVKSIMSMNDTVCVLPTSTGKSACFTIPTLCMGWRTIVIYPLVSLIRDQVQKMQKAGLAAGAITSQDKSGAANASVLQGWASGEIQFMLVSPERFANQEWANIVTQFPPDMIAMDECFTGDVEILTELGFVRFDELQDGVKVAQVDPSTDEMSIVLPTKVIRRRHTGEIVHIKSVRGIDLSVTPNHDLLLYRHDGTWEKRKASEANFNSRWRMIAAAGAGKGWSELMPVDRLQVMFLTDGKTHCKSSAEFTLTQQHKIDRFLSLMSEGEFKFRETEDSTPSVRRFIVRGVYGLSKSMREKVDYNELGAEACQALLEEAIAWEGRSLSDALGYYSSPVKENADYFQEVCIRAGWRSRLTKQVDNRKESYADTYRLFIRRNRRAIDTQKFQRTTEPYDGNVYCVSVPTQCIVVRREGKPVVIGNCHTYHDWADTFRHGYKVCGQLIQKLQPKVVSVFSATLSTEAEAEVRSGVGIPNAKLIYHYPRRTNLHLHTLECAQDNGIPRWVADNCDGPTVVFVSTRKRTSMMAMSISSYTNRNVYYYNGGMNPQERKQMQDLFMNDPDGIICATNAFGMGVDKPDIRNVVHLDPPGNLVSLAQECVHPDSMISTASGIKAATEVAVGEQMLDYRFEAGEYSPAMATQAMENQTEKLVRIRTKLGSTLSVSPNHPVFVKSAGGVVEVPASEVLVGDQLLAKLHLPPADPSSVDVVGLLTDCPEPVFVKVRPDMVDRLRQKLSPSEVSRYFRLSSPYDYDAYKEKKHGRLDYWLEACAAAGISESELRDNITHFKTSSSSSIELPVTLTADFGWWLGIVATDGHVSRVEAGGSKGYDSWRVRLGSTSDAIADKFAAFAESLGVNAHRYTRRPDGGSLAEKTMNMVECSHPILVHLCNKAGIPSGKKSYSVSVPKWLLAADAPLRAGFIAGVIDGDGCLSKAKHQLRIHSAALDFLSGVSMLLRGFGIPATCCEEDYTCKSEAMAASSDHGYSLLVTSAEHYEQLRGTVSHYSCKPWHPTRPPNAGQDMASQRQSRRTTIAIPGGEWLQDEVLEKSDVAYVGRVLNWRVEPGNQLVVDGILTHNCGRAGRDGFDSDCYIVASADGIRTRRRFIENGNPTPEEIRKFFRAACSMQEGDGGAITALRTEIADKAGISQWLLQSIMTFCLGEGIFVDDTKAARQHRVRFADVITSLTPKQRETRDAIFEIGDEEDGWWSFNLDNLAEQCALQPTSALRRLHVLSDAGVIDWVRATTKRPIRVKTHIDDVPKESWDRLQKKADTAHADFQLVLDYIDTEDDEKHDFLEAYINRTP